MIYSIAPSGRRPNVLPSLAEESKANGKKAVSFSADTSGSRGVVTTIVVPSGFLGIVVKSNLESGLSYVTRIKEDSPIKDQVKVGDQILEVDGEDVSKLRVIHVAMLMRSKRKNGSRTLTILRAKDETTRAEM